MQVLPKPEKVEKQPAKKVTFAKPKGHFERSEPHMIYTLEGMLLAAADDVCVS